MDVFYYLSLFGRKTGLVCNSLVQYKSFFYCFWSFQMYELVLKTWTGTKRTKYKLTRTGTDGAHSRRETMTRTRKRTKGNADNIYT